jgi:hypothetical protein
MMAAGSTGSAVTMRKLVLLSAFLAPLAGCLAEVPDNRISEAQVMWFPQIGTDERDFNSICSHFGNETALSYAQPYHRC